MLSFSFLINPLSYSSLSELQRNTVLSTVKLYQISHVQYAMKNTFSAQFNTVQNNASAYQFEELSALHLFTNQANYSHFSVTIRYM